MIPPAKRKTELDRNLIKKAVKLALDDLKAKYTGLLLSAHALKVIFSLSHTHTHILIFRCTNSSEKSLLGNGHHRL